MLISLQMLMNGSLKMIALSMSGTLSISRNGVRDNKRKRQGQRMMQKKAESLLEKLHERIAAAPPAKGGQRLRATSSPTGMDGVTRESHIRMISSLSQYYRPQGIELIVNQALIGKSNLSDLSDEELVDLLHAIDRARDCINDGISFEEAGLMKIRYG